MPCRRGECLRNTHDLGSNATAYFDRKKSGYTPHFEGTTQENTPSCPQQQIAHFVHWSTRGPTRPTETGHRQLDNESMFLLGICTIYRFFANTEIRQNFTLPKNGDRSH